MCSRTFTHEILETTQASSVLHMVKTTPWGQWGLQNMRVMSFNLERYVLRDRLGIFNAWWGRLVCHCVRARAGTSSPQRRRNDSNMRIGVYANESVVTQQFAGETWMSNMAFVSWDPGIEPPDPATSTCNCSYKSLACGTARCLTNSLNSDQKSNGRPCSRQNMSNL